MWCGAGGQRARRRAPVLVALVAATAATLLPAPDASATGGDRGRSDYVSDGSTVEPGYESANIARGLSDDGRYALYESGSPYFVKDLDDANGWGNDVFLRDMVTGDILVVSRTATAGFRTGNAASFQSTISADGRFVAFASGATDLDPSVAEVPAGQNVFVRDMATGETRMASISIDGTGGNGQSQQPMISADGRHTVFKSRAHNLVPGMPDYSAGVQLYRYDWQDDSVELVTVNAGGSGAGNREISEASMSGDGRFVAFSSLASDLIASGDQPNTSDVFLRDMLLGTTALVSRAQAAPGTATGSAEQPVISRDGSTVAFRAFDAAVLVAGVTDTNNTFDVFVWSRESNAVEVIDLASNGTSTAAGGAGTPRLSADGSVVAFLSASTDLVPGYSNGHAYPAGQIPPISWLPADVFARRRSASSTILVSRAAGSATTSGNRGATQPAVSANGALVVFESDATDLVPGLTDRNSYGRDTFAFRLDTQEMRAISLDDATGGTVTAYGASHAPYDLQSSDPPLSPVTPDGRFVVYTNYVGNGWAYAKRRAMEPPLPPVTPKPPARTPPIYSDPPPPGGSTTPPPSGGSTPAPPASGPSGGGYWMLSGAGAVYAFGGAASYGNATTTSAVDLEPSPSGKGYWILDSRGRVSRFGDARAFGSAVLPVGEKAVSLSVTRDGGGYWIFTDKGRALTFGNAPFKGDMSGRQLNAPVLGSVVTPSGAGYWMVAADGGIFSFGDATFHGSMGGARLNRPVMSMAPKADGSGYWLVASDGGIFAFDVPFYGSTGHLTLNKPISGMVPGKAGYLMVAQDGGVFAFGDVAFHGSLASNPPPSPVQAIALLP